ncbi:MAG TPA: chemotaxis protein CheA [Pirellulales bacterium]
MSDELDLSTGLPSAEMAQYLQMYLDETGEQLDALVESLLLLESNPTDAGQLNESFRLIHSIKGSSAMMGLSGVTVLTHHLESHFERLRSGLRELDQAAMALILRSIDFLRQCNHRLRSGETLASAPDLLDELSALGSDAVPTAVWPREIIAPVVAPPPSAPPLPATTNFRLLVQFEAEFPLADLKAELVLTRLAEIAQVRDTRPDRSQLERVAETHLLEVLLASARSAADVRAAADVHGVELIEVDPGATTFASPEIMSGPTAAAAPAGMMDEDLPAADLGAAAVLEKTDEPTRADSPQLAAADDAHDGKSKVVETVRVDIARLDKLMNLTGELVVNKARFAQVARQMAPAFRKSSLSGRARSFGQSMRRAIDLMKRHAGNGAGVNWAEQLHDLETELAVLETQAKLWEESRRGFGRMIEAIDQMARVSDNLQRGVLATRMVPVAPLFNRFKRVVRDTALEIGKQVRLEIHGEKTELDKRMIDELGDPLIHLIRNAIDHGIEPAEVRVARDKPAAGVIHLEASHSGNNVYIVVRDDGGGINVDKIRRRIVERGLLAGAAARELSEREVIDYIWHPGFSTAEAVSDISGRGVGMDIVKTRIAELNGVVEVRHTARLGTTFIIKLPLTLAIVRSLLFGVRDGVFAVPIDNVREIVSVPVDQVITVHGRRTFDLRGSFIPLVGIDDVFQWRAEEEPPAGADAPVKRFQVVILHAGDKNMGLRVCELHGTQEIVIKSLAENFIHLRGLSGASILGDGSVCLLLDVAQAIVMAGEYRPQRSRV